MKKGDIISLRIKGLSFPDKARGTIDIDGEEKRVQVKHALPGQLCQVRIIKKRGGKIEGQVINVLEKAPNEIPVDCGIFGSCGGCAFLNLPYDAQLTLKENHVMRLLDEAGISGFEKDDIIPSPEITGYRNKMEYSFGDAEPNGPLTLGLHQRGSFYNVLSTPDCQIADEDFNLIRSAVQAFFQEEKRSYFHKRTHEGFLRHLVIRKGKATGEILINLVTTSQSVFEAGKFVDHLINLPVKGKICGILHTVNDGLADMVRADEQRILFGKDHITDSILGLDFKITSGSFFQTNTFGAEKLYALVRQYVQAGAGHSEKTKLAETIFDLYCGTGTIAQIMSPLAEKVFGIELVEEAVEAAKINAEGNGLENCTFIAGDVMEKVTELTFQPQVIILDPPRAGIHPKAIFKIIDFAPDVFVYVACKPESLARDLPFFVQAGYHVDRVGCVDMFPHTANVETVALLTRKQA